MAEQVVASDLRISDLMDEVDNKYLLAAAVARRARQLKDGARPFVTVDKDTLLPVVTALHEMHQGFVRVVRQDAKDETQLMLEKMDDELEAELEEGEKAEGDSDDKKKNDKDGKKTKQSLAA